MVWVLSLSDQDLSTLALTLKKQLTAFGVYLEVVGFTPHVPISSSTSASLLIKAAPKSISECTSYLLVRLAFHPYPQLIQIIFN